LRLLARRARAVAHAATGPAAAAAVCRLALEQTPLALPPAAGAVVAGTWPVGSELDARPLLAALAARGWRCALPVVADEAGPLRFRAWLPGEPLRAGGYGILEPEPAAPAVVPDVVLVPLLAFDRAGRRLGQGGGWYDRTLAALRAERPVLAIGLAFAAQERAELPTGGHDQPLDWIVTEKAAYPVRCP
jgi:5-formyltetrahydrofolate cyclo-ligase